MMHQTTGTETVPAVWESLYKIGGIAALIGAAIVPIQTVIFIAWPPPALDAPASEWFALFQLGRSRPIRFSKALFGENL